jgi:hypothetical protein
VEFERVETLMYQRFDAIGYEAFSKEDQPNDVYYE